MTRNHCVVILPVGQFCRSRGVEERNIVAAILASNLATFVREKGNSFAVAAEHAVMMYDAILKELAKANLPPPPSSEPSPEPPAKPRSRPA